MKIQMKASNPWIRILENYLSVILIASLTFILSLMCVKVAQQINQETNELRETTLQELSLYSD